MSDGEKHFRWSLVWIPLAVLAAMWLMNGVEPAGTWNEFMNAIGIENKPRYTAIAILGTLICSALIVARVLGYGKEEGE